ncbi:metal ABC transporter ATP-binding protein [Aerosakkonema funiforme]|uniref:Metal ABC transporter ATP-binding protein n=1 Tax=Aerosakkonema funiforme FACHB-1375 TaxID=2949571 RepID=A0A926VKM1_9CYAN|nr:metal ABC transporter ATP-binding protein [Aerosakkonema funiforme]MBD2184497.1 metal ABC transporter ATP-binding protein [Aerosakkonema funiforme FACHB-1375]
MKSIKQETILPPVLKVEGLTVYRGTYPAVRDVSFELLPGTDTAVIGPNGSGKSTLVQAMLDLIAPTSGTVEIFGRPVKRLGRLRREIGYIPQHFIFDRSFPISVAELVGLGWDNERQKLFQAELWERKQKRQKHNFRIFPFSLSWHNPEKEEAIARSLQRVNAYHLRKQAIGTLSGGELKRVLLAYCLVSPRRLLVLDEAFAGVDVSGEADFYALLNELKNEQYWTILQVSHDLDMVNRHCDRVLCLNQTLVCSGSPDIILSPENLLATYGPAFSRYQHRH